MVDAVIFDLDGVLIDSEQVWDEVRRQFVEEAGGRWRPGATEAMMGMSSPEWSRYIADELGVALSPSEINEAVVERLIARYREDLPLLPGACGVVRAMAGRWPLGLASSSNRPLIDACLEMAGLTTFFAATVSSEEVARGKPAPDVYLATARLLGRAPPVCAVVEDSANGIASASAAGMTVVAVPNAHFPPPPEILAQAAAVVPSVAELTPEVVEGAAAPR